MYSVNVRLRYLALLPLIVWNSVAYPDVFESHPSEVFQPILPVKPPHCTRIQLVHSTYSHAAGEKMAHQFGLQVILGLQHTICFRIGNGSSSPDEDVMERNDGDGWLHTLTLTQLEQYHKIKESYTFAIPELRASCICDCNNPSEVCSRDYEKESCSKMNLQKNAFCYHRYETRPNPPGCSPNAFSNVCCEISLSPYKNNSYAAVKLGAPNTFAVFKYAAYDYTAGRWVEKDKSTIRVSTDSRTQNRFLDRGSRIELGVTAMGKTSHELPAGMYCARSNPGGEMDELRENSLLNQLNEADYQKLGWFRLNVTNGRFEPTGTSRMLSHVDELTVIDCKEQRMGSLLAARNYVDVNNGDKNYALGDLVEQQYQWIQSAHIRDGSSREAVVVHSEGTNLDISLSMPGSNRAFSFYHDFSTLGDFTGTIIVDFKSNRFFNLTVYNATGVLSGNVKKSIDKNSLDDFSFTTYIDELRGTNKTVIVPVPEMIGGGDRLICIRPDEAPPKSEICRIIPFREDPLEINLLENTWKELEGHCPDCNKISMAGFLSNLNPLNWASGAASLSKFIMVTADAFLYIVIAIVAYFVITRCIYPLAKCFICPAESVLCCYHKAHKKHKCRHQSYRHDDYRHDSFRHEVHRQQDYRHQEYRQPDYRGDDYKQQDYM